MNVARCLLLSTVLLQSTEALVRPAILGLSTSASPMMADMAWAVGGMDVFMAEEQDAAPAASLDDDASSASVAPPEPLWDSPLNPQGEGGDNLAKNVGIFAAVAALLVFQRGGLDMLVQ